MTRTSFEILKWSLFSLLLLLSMSFLVGFFGSFVFVANLADPTGGGPSISDVVAGWLRIMILSTASAVSILVLIAVYWFWNQWRKSEQDKVSVRTAMLKFLVICLPLLTLILALAVQVTSSGFWRSQPAPPKIERQGTQRVNF